MGTWFLPYNLVVLVGDVVGVLSTVLMVTLDLKFKTLSLSVVQDASSLSWATVLAVVWLHSNAMQMKGEWELLEKKARDWIHIHAGRSAVLRLHLLPSLGS